MCLLLLLTDKFSQFYIIIWLQIPPLTIVSNYRVSEIFEYVLHNIRAHKSSPMTGVQILSWATKQPKFFSFWGLLVGFLNTFLLQRSKHRRRNFGQNSEIIKIKIVFLQSVLLPPMFLNHFRATRQPKGLNESFMCCTCIMFPCIVKRRYSYNYDRRVSCWCSEARRSLPVCENLGASKCIHCRLQK